MFYLAINNERCGPFSSKKIRAFLKEKRVDWTTPVWREGLPGWIMLGDLDEFTNRKPEVLSLIPEQTHNEEKPWLLFSREQETGPFSTEEVIKMLKARKLRQNTYAFRHGMKKWQRLFHITEFASYFSRLQDTPKVSNSPLRNSLEEKEKKHEMQPETPKTTTAKENLEKVLGENIKKLALQDKTKKDEAILAIERIIRDPDTDFFQTKFFSLISGALDAESDQTYVRKINKLIQMVESRNFVTSKATNEIVKRKEINIESEGPIPNVSSVKVEDRWVSSLIWERIGFKKRRSRFVLLVPLILLIFLVWFFGNKSGLLENFSNMLPGKKAQEIHQKEANSMLHGLVDKLKGQLKTRGTMLDSIAEIPTTKPQKKATDYSKHYSEKIQPLPVKRHSGSEAYRYHGMAVKTLSGSEDAGSPEKLRVKIRFFPEKGMKVKMKTNIVRKVYINGALQEKTSGEIIHIEEVSNLYGDSFETRFSVTGWSPQLKDLNYYKFINVGEKAFLIYDMHGKLTDYRYNGDAKYFFKPDSYLNFLFPVRNVTLNQFWGKSGDGLSKHDSLVYRAVGFSIYDGHDVLKVEFSSMPSYRTQINDNPDRKVLARVRGRFLVDVGTGFIRFLSVRTTYNYKLSPRGGDKRISFNYHSVIAK